MIDNLFSSLSQDTSSELFTDLLKHENLRIERIISNGHSSPDSGWYKQETHEWVIVLKGEAKILFEDDEVHLVVGSYINIPAYRKHKVSWTSPNTETVWLAVHYN